MSCSIRAELLTPTSLEECGTSIEATRRRGLFGGNHRLALLYPFLSRLCLFLIFSPSSPVLDAQNRPEQGEVQNKLDYGGRWIGVAPLRSPAPPGIQHRSAVPYLEPCYGAGHRHRFDTPAVNSYSFVPSLLASVGPRTTCEAHVLAIYLLLPCGRLFGVIDSQ